MIKIANELQKLIDAIKEFFKSANSKDYYFVCTNCNTRFDGSVPEYFIKHQIDEKHFDYVKVLKSDG